MLLPTELMEVMEHDGTLEASCIAAAPTTQPGAKLPSGMRLESIESRAGRGQGVDHEHRSFSTSPSKRLQKPASSDLGRKGRSELALTPRHTTAAATPRRQSASSSVVPWRCSHASHAARGSDRGKDLDRRPEILLSRGAARPYRLGLQAARPSQEMSSAVDFCTLGIQLARTPQQGSLTLAARAGS